MKYSLLLFTLGYLLFQANPVSANIVVLFDGENNRNFNSPPDIYSNNSVTSGYSVYGGGSFAASQRFDGDLSNYIVPSVSGRIAVANEFNNYGVGFSGTLYSTITTSDRIAGATPNYAVHSSFVTPDQILSRSNVPANIGSIVLSTGDAEAQGVFQPFSNGSFESSLLSLKNKKIENDVGVFDLSVSYTDSNNNYSGQHRYEFSNINVYDSREVEQAVYINWEESPDSFVQQCNIFGNNCATHVDWGNSTSHIFESGDFFDADREFTKTGVLSELRGIFNRSELFNIPIFDDPELLNEFDNVTTVNFHDFLGFDPSLTGKAYYGVDHLNQSSRNDDVMVFWNSETLSYILDQDYDELAEVIAHELAHSFGARHMENSFISNEIMDYDISGNAVFSSIAQPIGLPSRMDPTIEPNEGELHNVRYHIGQGANDENSRDADDLGLIAGPYDLRSDINLYRGYGENLLSNLYDADIGYYDYSSSLHGEEAFFVSLIQGKELFDETIVLNNIDIQDLVLVGKSQERLDGHDVISTGVSLNSTGWSFELSKMIAPDRFEAFGSFNVESVTVAEPSFLTIFGLAIFALFFRKINVVD